MKIHYPRTLPKPNAGCSPRDPDSLVIFTQHEEERAFAVELVVRNLPPVEPFVVEGQYPRFVRKDGLDPTRLKQVGGRPAKYTPEDLLTSLGDRRLTTTEWKQACHDEQGISPTRFFELLRRLAEAGKAVKSVIDDKWEPIQRNSRNWHDEKDQ